MSTGYRPGWQLASQQAPRAWAEAAVEAEARGLAAEAGPGERNHRLNRAAFRAGQVIPAGELDPEAVAARLLAEAEALGLKPAEARATVASGLRAGMRAPRQPKEGDRQPPPANAHQRAAVAREPAPAPSPHRPPQRAVLALWQAARCLGEAPELGDWPGHYKRAADYLAGRGYDLDAAGEVDVVRVLPPAEAYRWPPWWPWGTAGRWCLAALAYEADGTPASIHARAVGAVAEGEPKTRWPRGFEARGLFMADALGRWVLRGDPRARDVDALLVAEGLTDTLAASCWASADCKPENGHRERVGVLGVVEGSAPALARVTWPEGLAVWIGTDPDAAGDKYAVDIAKYLPLEVTLERLELRNGEA